MQIFIQIFLSLKKDWYFLHFQKTLSIMICIFYFCFLKMKNFRKFWLIILWISWAFLIWNFTQAKDYEYTDLDIKADVKIDWTIDVTETFTTNFLKKKHWIVRFIPLNYTVEDSDFHIDLDYIRVDWNKFTTYNEDWGINIKIWDPNVEIIWKKVYPIFYSVYWLIRNFAWKWYHELYWNLVWYDFDTNINRVKAEIKLPKIYNWFSNNDFLITTDGKTTTVEDFDWIIDRSAWDKIIISYNKRLDAREWITLAIKFPKDYFTFDHDKQANLLWHIGSNWNSSNSYSSSSSFLSNILSDSDSLSSILTFLIIILWMFFMPNSWWGWSYSSWWSYSRSSWFSSWSSFWWGFSRGWWGGWWGSKSW